MDPDPPRRLLPADNETRLGAVIARCESLDQFYGPQQVLFNVTLSVEAGCTGLLGNNGAGKSTLIRTLLGQLPVGPGQVELVGYDPSSEPLLVRQRVGYMPESDIFLPGLTALELVAFCGQLSGMRRTDAVRRAHEVLHFVQLGEARYREVDGYSTGMRQRVKLAACLVHGPALLLLDEPTTGLDPSGREEMLALIDDLSRERGLSVLLSSHILRDIERTCDRVVVLHEGRVRFSGLREKFQHRQAERLHVRVKADRRHMARALVQAGCEVDDRPGAGLLEVGLPEGGEPQLVFRLARENGLQVRHLASASDSLEQAYSRALNDEQGEGR